MFIAIIIFTSTVTKMVKANYVAGASASLDYNLTGNNLCVDNKSKNSVDYSQIKRVMRKVLQSYDSPLVTHVDAFVSACIKNDLSCFLLPSIAGLESTFGKFILPGSNNPFGWGGGLIRFSTWDEGIDTVATGLKRHYIDKGAVTIDQIAPIYSESTTWAPRVQYFVNKFDSELKKDQLFLSEK